MTNHLASFAAAFAIVFVALLACSSLACSAGAPASPRGGDVVAPLPKIPARPPQRESVPDALPTWPACQASEQAWVRRAVLAVAGRRTRSQAEVDVYEDLLRATNKRAVLAMLTDSDDFRVRWADFFMDALHVARIDDKMQEPCYGTPDGRSADPSLARWIRSHAATHPRAGNFTMREILASSIAVDDLSVLYRANLFAMVAKPLSGANLDHVALERARREDLGGVFDAVYLNRNLVCLGCHNSEFSVTYDADPALNRAWPTRGRFELALFGASDGRHDAADAVTKGTDFMRAHSMLRHHGVADQQNGVAPYGWDAARCGSFARPAADELLGIDAYFGSLRGGAVSVWDLEESLRRGVDALTAHGVIFGEDDAVTNPDEAFAYLVAQNVVDQVWAEVMGSRLTIANGYPRNVVERDILEHLTTRFVASHFSLVALLTEIVTHPAFNLKAPDEGCGDAAYSLPPAFDPWTIGNADATLRANGVGDGVHPLPPRLLVRSLHRALGWPDLAAYPIDAGFQANLGFFLKDSAPGHRGLDFQGRLAWEYVYGACSPPAAGDFIARVGAFGRSVPNATLGDALIALKDRLLGEPNVDEANEAPMLAALLESPLATPLANLDAAMLDASLRRACGLFAATPAFMLGGLPPPDARAIPKLTLPEASYRASCERAAPAMARAGQALQCGADELSVTSAVHVAGAAAK